MEQEPYAASLAALQRYRSLLDQYMSLRARELGIHVTDVSALSYILQHTRSGSCITPGELGARLALSGPATTAVIDRLERAGYVQRHQSATDGRRVEVHIARAAAGEEDAAVEPILISVRQALAAFSPDQIQTFEVIMTTIANRMAQDLGLPAKGRKATR